MIGVRWGAAKKTPNSTEHEQWNSVYDVEKNRYQTYTIETSYILIIVFFFIFVKLIQSFLLIRFLRYYRNVNMADVEFEEFCKYFEEVPQHIKASTRTYK